MTGKWVGVGLVLSIGSSACSGGTDVPSSADESAAESTEALLADHARCENGRLQTLDAVCSQSLVYHGGSPGAGASISPDLLYDIRLLSDGSQNTGSVRFVPPATGEWAFYLGTPNIPFSIRAVGGGDATVCTRYISDALATELTGATCRLRGVYVAQLLQGQTYQVDFGPTDLGRKQVTLFAKLSRLDGVVPREARDCSVPELAALTGQCSIASNTTALNAGTLGAVSAPVLTLDTAVGLHLATVSGQNEGSVEFVPPYTDDYLVSLGLPNIKVRVTSAAADVPLTCGESLSAQRKTDVTGAACDPIRSAFVVRLPGGQPARLELGRIAIENKWLRLLVSSTSPDSDGDGVSDGLDGCPNDPNPACADADNCALAELDQGDGQNDGTGDEALLPLAPTVPVEKVVYSSVSALPAPTEILSPSGVPNQDARYQVFLSRTGRYVTFSSDASNLVRSDANGTTDVFRVDRSNGRFQRVSVGDSGEQLSGEHVGVAASDNGCKVAFITRVFDGSRSLHGPLRVWDCNTCDSVEVEPDIALPKTFTPTAFDRGAASFSSDGTWLAFNATLLNLDTHARTALPMQLSPFYTPITLVAGNGNRVLFEDFFAQPHGIKAYERTTANLRLLWGSTDDFDITSFRAPQDTTRNGNIFAFDSSFYPALNYELSENAFVADLKAGTVLQLAVDPSVDSPCVINNEAGYEGWGFFTRVSSDGSTAAFGTCSSVDVVNLATRARRRFQWPATSKWGPGSLDLSADGQHLAFITPTTLGSDPHVGTETVPVPRFESVSGPGDFGRDVFVIDLVAP